MITQVLEPAAKTSALILGGNQTDAHHEAELSLWFADFPTADWAVEGVISFTCFWKRDQRWAAPELASSGLIKARAANTQCCQSAYHYE
jgi:hypothetical protein